MRKVGIIGNGFVGNSIAFGFSPTHEVKVHDKDIKRNINTIEEVLDCDYVFVCVPTPMNPDGSMNIDIVERALDEINEKNKKDNVIILKSTMIPGTSALLQDKYKKLNIQSSQQELSNCLKIDSCIVMLLKLI